MTPEETRAEARILRAKVEGQKRELDLMREKTQRALDLLGKIDSCHHSQVDRVLAEIADELRRWK